ncbi:MAG: M28 family metallopeptidase [Bacteroidales bacterium]
MKSYHNVIWAAAILFLVSCNSQRDFSYAEECIKIEDMKNYISVLASDDLQGRFPGTTGEEKTINYLADQFKQIGALPGNGNRYFQEVPLIKITPEKEFSLKITGGNQTLNLSNGSDFIGGTPLPQENINIENSDIVFIGYGINAPEYGWNDYEGIDVKGKTVLVLVNDPGYVTKDTALFMGNAMTYYGRWVYKYEEAARQGATGAIIIHETAAASYPWGVVQNSWTGSRFFLANNPITSSSLKFQSWISNENARKLFAQAGYNFDSTIRSAANKGFKPIDLKQKASINFKNTVEYVKSNNVVALLLGSDRKDEYIIYAAHWDHFGINPEFKGDSILNGALDNATGTAALLEIAAAFKSLKEVQDRSILFMAVTCEEQGLLGSEYYCDNPIYPLNKTVAVINMDALNIFGRTKDMAIAGLGYSELDNYAIEILKNKGRYVIGDSNPEQGGYYRSDHFSFAKVGVPSINISFGDDNIEHGKEWSQENMMKWIMENYHKPSDNYEPEKWKFDGMIEDLKVYFELGYNLSTTDKFPNWHQGIPYRIKRDEMMK